MGRATLSYRQARDSRSRSAAQASALVGHVVRLRGTVYSVNQNSGSNSTTLGFAPSAAPSGVTASLPFCNWRDAAPRALVGRDVVLTGTLTQSSSGVQLAGSHPSWVQVVP